jgi:uncharacterized protein YjbI with pentapeptide repeats
VRFTDLSEAILRGADLREAILFGTILRGADLHGADLRLTTFLTQEQLNTACLDHTTQLPAHLTYPSARPALCDRYR